MRRIFQALKAVALGTALAASAPLALAQNTAPAGTEARVSIDHAAWSSLLGTYVEQGADGLNRFDYGALQASQRDRVALASYIDSFAEIDFDALSREEAFVAWVNLYNALTVQHIIGRYPLDSIRDGYLFGGPWKDVTTIADGREVSLDDIEHNILRADWDEPRVHYAVNCASIGCPNLKPTAWNAARLEEDLTEAARAYINHPRGVTVRERGGLTVSRIYKWFEEDFGGNEVGVIDHLLQYADADLAEAIAANRDIRGHAYDWSLNDVE